MIPLFKVNIDNEAKEKVFAALGNDNIDFGQNVCDFEIELCKYFGVKSVATINDFSCAIYLSLKECGVGQGDEVIMSPLVCLAVSMPVVWTGATIIWCDINPEYATIDPESVDNKMSSKTKAVIVSHWNGNVSNTCDICSIAHRRGVKVIEDASNAIFSERNGNSIANSTADFVVFSLHSTKHITTIRGAFIVSDEINIDHIKDCRRFGVDKSKFLLPNGNINDKYNISNVGYSFYMNEVEAALGISQMEVATNIKNVYYRNGKMYDNILLNNKNIKIFKYLDKPSYWTYSFLAYNRDDLINHLLKNGIKSQKLHARNDRYEIFGNYNACLIGVDEIDKYNISVPCGWWVSEDDIIYISEMIDRFYL